MDTPLKQKSNAFRVQATRQLDCFVDEFLYWEFSIEDLKSEFYSRGMADFTAFIYKTARDIIGSEEVSLSSRDHIGRLFKKTANFVQLTDKITLSIDDRTIKPGPIVKSLESEEIEKYETTAGEIRQALLDFCQSC